MRYPVPPAWGDIEMVWLFFAYLSSRVFENLMIAEVAERAHEAIKDFSDDYFHWPPKEDERRHMIDDFLTRIVASVTDQIVRAEHMLTLNSMYSEAYLAAVSDVLRQRIGNVQEADLQVVSDDFDFARFRNAFVENLPRIFIEKYVQSQWNAFYDSWGDRAQAQMSLTEEHKHRIGNSEVWLFPHQIDQLMASYVQAMEASVRASGGNVGGLFPWPVV